MNASAKFTTSRSAATSLNSSRAAPHHRAVGAAGAGQRSDPAVHQLRHGAVQGRVPGRGKAQLRACGRRPALPARGRATTTSTRSATPPATTPSSRCWAAGRSATTSRRTATAWELLTQVWKLPAERPLVTVYQTDDEAYACGATWSVCRKGASCASATTRARSSPRQLLADGRHRPVRPCTEIFYDHGDHIAGGPPAPG